MNLTLLIHTLGRRDWRDPLWTGLPTLRAFIAVMAITFGLLIVLVGSLLWHSREQDLPRVIGGWAYVLAPLWTLLILIRAEAEFRPERNHSHESIAQLVLALGRPSRVYAQLLAEPLVVIAYRWLRPASLLLIAGLGSYLSLRDVGRMLFGGATLLFATCAAYLFLSLLARTRYQLRVGIVAYWLLVFVLYVLVGLNAPIRRLCSPWAIVSFVMSLAPSRLPANLAAIAPTWLLLAVLACVVSLPVMRVALAPRGRRPRRRSAGPIFARELTTAQAIRAAMDGDARFARDRFRTLSTIAGYVVLGLIPVFGWLAVAVVFEWLLAARLKSLVGCRALDDVRLAGMEADDIGTGLRDVFSREAHLAAPGLVVALLAMIIGVLQTTLVWFQMSPIVWVMCILVGLPVACVFSVLFLKATVQAVTRYVPRGVVARSTNVSTSVAGMMAIFAPEFLLTRLGFFTCSLLVFLLALTITLLVARLGRRSEARAALGEWIERDALPNPYSMWASPDDKFLLGPEYYRER